MLALVVALAISAFMTGVNYAAGKYCGMGVGCHVPQKNTP